MSTRRRSSGRAIRGTIRRRLLVNATVDPDEAAARLPAGVRPHVVHGRTVVGSCLLDIEALRPDGLPSFAGRPQLATAHRISASWDEPSGATVVGVYVPVRHTDAHLAIAIGGRLFPGVHQRARIERAASETHLRWTSVPAVDADRLTIHVAATLPAALDAHGPCDPIGTTCVGASIGGSPDRRGRLEAARMEPSHRDVCEVVVDELASPFLDGFRTAEPSTSYLMRDAEVVWTRAAAPNPITLRESA